MCSSDLGDGRFVAFVSEATNLVPGDTNGVDDIYVHDRTTGSTRRMSISRRGKEPDEESFSVAISANGRWIAFTSGATTLVRGDTNGEYDVFVRDRTRRTIRRVSVSSAGTEGTGFSDRGSFSANGRYVAFHSTSEDLVPGDTNGVMDIFLRDQLKQRTRRISLTPSGGQVDGASSTPTLSANARYVAFDSSATDLVPGDANGTYDVFLRDRRTRTTTIVSVRSGGDAANGGSSFPAISADARYVVFASTASNLVDGDTNGKEDVFLHDRVTRTTTRISVATDGTEGDDDAYSGAPSGHAEVVVFRSWATTMVANDTNDLQDIFVRIR